MKKNKLSKKQKVLLFVWAVIIFSINTVSAATSAELKICEYAGVLRTLKIVGIILNIVKIVIPLLLIITGIVALAKTVISGKDDDLKSNLMILIKKLIAGLVIFLLPGVIDYAFDTLTEFDDSKFTACTTCLLDIDNCKIPEADPITYIE